MRSKTVCIAFVATLLLAFPVLAQDFANPASGGPGVMIVTQGSWASFDLVVSGPNEFSSVERFAGTATPAIAVSGLADGTYNWELRANPALSWADQNALAEARANGGPRPDVPAGALSYGSFTLVNGSVVLPNDGAIEEVASGGVTLAQVINTDLIVVGSACVGLDCVNGESFGFDTLRLKENNLRIHFNDTSNSASFPTTDWRILANETGNGGENYLAIEESDAGTIPFRIRNGAGNHAMYVDQQGDLGLNTSAPVVELHIADGDTPTVRLEQTGASGFTPQTWDIAGNEANFFVRDVTNGSQLAFKIKPGADENTLALDAQSQVGIGTDAPNAKLEVRGDVAITTTNAQNISPQMSLVNDVEAGFIIESTDPNGFPWQLESRNNGTFVISNEDQPSNPPFKIFGANVQNNMLVLRARKVNIGSTSMIAPTAIPAGEIALDVNGPIFQRSATTLFADYVFDDDYELMSIEDQAAFMQENKHLPAVPGRTVDEEGKEIVELGARNTGMLEELEKAHLYIVQLNDSIQEKDDRIAELEERLAAIEAMLADN
ncbi:MAG: hypothetical protein AAGD38_24010 [Acidobacteriota bacterium]